MERAGKEGKKGGKKITRGLKFKLPFKGIYF